MWYLVMKNANRGKLGNDEREKEQKMGRLKQYIYEQPDESW